MQISRGAVSDAEDQLVYSAVCLVRLGVKQLTDGSLENGAGHV